MRRAFVVSAVLALAVIPTGVWALAAAGPPKATVRLTPSTGSPHTTFALSFRAPERTGSYGASQRHDVITLAAHPPARGCIARLSVHVADASAGAHVRVMLAPRRLGGSWCPGTYRGRIEEVETPVCPRGALCPATIRLLRTVGRFTFEVKRATPGSWPPEPPPVRADTTPPSFTGLQRAFACTPGAQRPGQTTPFTLSWQAASDDVTPSSGIVYEVYLAATPGGENYSAPTWTTPAGLTSYRTPGLASHGTYYFVVRARDGAGNEDRNTVQQPGVDPCY